MDLGLLQQKMNSFIEVVSSWNRNVGKMYHSSTPEDVTVQLIDNNGNVIDSTMPNVAKFRKQIWDDVGGALGQIGKRVYINSVDGDDSNDGSSTVTPFKTLKKAIESGVKGVPLYISYMCDNDGTYVYEIDDSITCYVSSISISRHVAGEAKFIFKQSTENDNYHAINCFGNLNIDTDLYITIEIENKRAGTNPNLLGIIRQFNGKLTFSNRSVINLGDSGISFLYGHPADGCTSIECSTYYKPITTNGSYFIHNNLNTPVILNSSVSPIDDSSKWIKNIVRNTGGTPLNVVSNLNFSL